MFFSDGRLKLLEIKAGVDGFMVYDLNLIEPMQKVSAGLSCAHYYSPEPPKQSRHLFACSSSDSTLKEITSSTSFGVMS